MFIFKFTAFSKYQRQISDQRTAIIRNKVFEIFLGNLRKTGSNKGNYMVQRFLNSMILLFFLNPLILTEIMLDKNSVVSTSIF